MYLLLSGEGATDIGCAKYATGDKIYSLAEWKLGPMSYFVDAEVRKLFKYSPIESGSIYFLPEAALKKISKVLKGMPDCPCNSAYYIRNAQALLAAAQYLWKNTNTPVVSVLFRDTDGTHNSSRLRDTILRESIRKPFRNTLFPICPMIPKPKSEAWILCALQKIYQHCEQLEELSGNDNSPHSAKTVLKDLLNTSPTRETLVEHILCGNIAYHRIDMPSLHAFREDFRIACDTASPSLVIPEFLQRKLLEASRSVLS